MLQHVGFILSAFHVFQEFIFTHFLLVSSAYNFYKQIGPRSDLTNHRA